jgi:hypothetical protein
MEEANIQRLLALRKLTRLMSDLLRGQLKEYLATLAPLLRPKMVFGEYIQGGAKEMVKGADKAFAELQGLYEGVAGGKPFFLSKELKPPFEIISAAIEFTPTEYDHHIETGKGSKAVTVTKPLKWVLNYAGFTPARLGRLLADRGRNADEVQAFLLHALVMHIVVSRQTGIAKILDALHFPFSTGYQDEFGKLPLTFISSSVSTHLPPDEVILQSTELSGMDAFEEIVNLDDIARIANPMKEQLLRLAEEQVGNP